MRACESEDLPAVPGAPRPAAHRLVEWAFGCSRCGYAIGAYRSRIGCTSAGGDHHRRFKDECRDPSTIYRDRSRLSAHRPQTRTQARHRGLLGRTHQPIGAGIRRRDAAPRHLGGSLAAAGLDSVPVEHLLLLRPGARHRRHARRAAGPGRGASPTTWTATSLRRAATTTSRRWK